MGVLDTSTTVEEAFWAGRRCGVQKTTSTIECPFTLAQPWERAAWLDGFVTGQAKAHGGSHEAKQGVLNLLSRYGDMRFTTDRVGKR